MNYHINPSSISSSFLLLVFNETPYGYPEDFFFLGGGGVGFLVPTLLFVGIVFKLGPGQDDTTVNTF